MIVALASDSNNTISIWITSKTNTLVIYAANKPVTVAAENSIQSTTVPLPSIDGSIELWIKSPSRSTKYIMLVHRGGYQFDVYSTASSIKFDISGDIKLYQVDMQERLKP